MAKERIKLEEMIASQKQNEKALHKRNAGRGKKSGKKGKNRKKNFGAKVTELTLTEEELAIVAASELATVAASSISVTTLSAKNEKIESKSKKVRHKKKQSFQHHTSPTGQDYYSNLETNETTWKLPTGAIVVEKGEKTKNPTGTKKQSFRRLKTSENGREYYQNVDQPKETTWTVPADAEILTMDSHAKNPNLGPKKRQSKTMN